MRGLTGNILRTFSTQVPSLIISIVAGVFLTRLLGAEGKGVYALFYANIEIMVMVFLFGCDLGIIYFGSNKKISESKLQTIALYIISIFIPLVAITILFFDFDFLFPKNYNTKYFKLFLIGMFSLRLINSIIAAFIKVAKSFKVINRIDLFNSVFNALTYFVLFYLNFIEIINVSIDLIFGISFIVLSLNSLLWIISFFRVVNLNLDLKLSLKEDVIPFFRYIFPVFISLIINFLNYRFDIWLVSYYKGNTQLGLYVLAVNFAQFILLYSRIIGGVMMPYLSEDDDIQRKKYFTTYSRINFTSVLIMVIILAIVGDSLLVLLYGKEFTLSGIPFNILLIGMVFTAMSQLFSIMLFSKGKNNVALIANSVGLISTILFDILLIPKYGIVGAAAATSISYFLLFMVLLVNLLVKEKINFFSLFLIRKSDFTSIFQND